MNLNSILIGSEDPQRLTDYYTALFGKPGWEGGDFNGWQIGTGYITIGPHDQVKGRNPHPGRLIWNIETADVAGESNGSRLPGPPWSRSPISQAAGPTCGSPHSPTRTTTTSSSSVPCSAVVQLAARAQLVPERSQGGPVPTAGGTG